MSSFWTFTPKMKTNDLITTIFRLMDEHFLKKKCTVCGQNLFLSMKLFGERAIRERITKLSEYISFCWALLCSV